ncbi:hypothetical protein GJ496_005110 [Pomphorhynchus laevis]|nr:hypothetical protein GJ496_005110 [Pomphorhynchus laevis]
MEHQKSSKSDNPTICEQCFNRHNKHTCLQTFWINFHKTIELCPDCMLDYVKDEECVQKYRQRRISDQSYQAYLSQDIQNSTSEETKSISQPSDEIDTTLDELDNFIQNELLLMKETRIDDFSF